MKYLVISLIIIFYIFFFSRSYLLSKSIKKSIKAKDKILNITILLTGISTIIFLTSIIFETSSRYLLIIYSSKILTRIGTLAIATGLILSMIASLSLKNSWRIGVNKKEKTKLITTGIYKISRNPYFLAYDIVLLAMTIYKPSIFLIIPALTTIILFHILILEEEKYLEEKHKKEYRNYKSKTKRYLI